MLTRERIEEALSEAVDRGRMTSADAQGLASALLDRGRKQTNDVLKDLEGLLARGRARGRGPHHRRAQGGRRRRGSGARPGLGRAQSRGARAAAGPLAQADRARRAAGVGPNFPIIAYDDLTADQVREPADRPHAGRAAEGARLRAPEREPQDGAERDRVEAQLTSKLG